MRNKILIGFFVFFSVLAAASQVSIYEVVNPPDTNQPFVSAHDSVNELGENFIYPEFDGDFDFIEAPAKDIYKIENGNWVLVKDDGDDNSVNGQNNSCDQATPDVYGVIKRSVIDNSNDVDWYKGTRSSNGKVRVVLVPPNNKNYDVEIWDDCNTWKKTCSAGRGELENCAVTSGISGDFYVMVKGVGGDWSQQAPYYVMAYNDEPCSFDLYAGRPTKDSYECMDAIQVDNTRISNRTNDTFKITFRQDLWLPSGEFQNETNEATYDIQPNGHAYASGRHYAPQNGWPENGTYTARAVIIGYCDGTDAINASKINSSPSPNVQCQSCQDECSYSGQKRCNGNYSETCGNYDGDSCLEWGGGQYCSNGCNQQNGQCNSCESHHHDGCFDNDIYWYNSCDEREERKEDCRVSCEYSQEGYYCIDGCLGKFAVIARNERGGIESNATISFKHQGMNDFQFAGLTNSEGKLSFSDIFDQQGNACSGIYQIQAVTASGGDCGIRSTRIESEGDQDGVMFTCPIVNNDNFLRVAPDGPERIKLGEILDLRALITDRYYNPVSAALVGVNRPYNDTPLSDNTDSQGNASFLDDRVPAGSHNFQFIGSKVGYNYGGAWKRVTVEPQQASVQVRDNVGNPVWHAKILIEENIVGYTDNDGRLTVDVNEQINTFEARNTDDIHCGYRTIRVGEQANFICPEMPLLRVEVDNNHSLPLTNVVVVLDGEFVDFTTVFGYTVSTAPSGEHLVEIYYKFDENSYTYKMSEVADIDGSSNTVYFVADQEHGEIVDEENLSIKGLTDQNVSGQLAFIPVVFIVVDLISIYLSIEDTCSCLVQHNNNSQFNMDYCKATLSSTYLGGLPALVAATAAFRAANVEVEQCPLQYAGLVFDVSPGTGSGILAKLGVLAFAAKVANKLPLNEVKVGLNFLGQKLKSEVISEVETKLIGHEWDYYIKFDEAGNYVKQIWLRTGYKLFRETSEYLDNALIDVGIRPVQRTLDGIGFHVIPDQIEYVQKMLDYAVKAFRQGFDPLGNGIHQLQKLFKRNTIRTQVGEEFVEATVALKKGSREQNFGWDHIVARNHNNEIREALNLSDADESVKDVIKEVVETARTEDVIYIPGEKWEIRKNITRNGKSKNILVVVSDRPGNVGSIQTAHPE